MCDKYLNRPTCVVKVFPQYMCHTGTQTRKNKNSQVLKLVQVGKCGSQESCKLRNLQVRKLGDDAKSDYPRTSRKGIDRGGRERGEPEVLA